MIMSKDLSFDYEYWYEDDEEGIHLPVKLTFDGRTVGVTAKVDPGAAVCLFRNEIGIKLGVPIDQGIPIKLGGLTGTLEAFGHEVTLRNEELSFQSIVYFAKYPGLPRNLLGRRGWLRNLRLAVIDYDNLLYLSDYDS
jgi:hypothetical protein